MSRQERHAQKRREALERALAPLPGTVPVSAADLAAAVFHDHADLVRGLAEVLERQGLPEAFEAMARHLEEDRELWLRRLARIEAEPALRARRGELDEDYLALLEAHFGRWGAGGVQGARIARTEAALALAAWQNALRQWLRGDGRPVLPVLAHEALGVLWPALYGHARRYAPKA